MRRIALFASITIAACASDEPTLEQRCEHVRDRVIDLRLANAAGVDVSAHRVAMRQALGDRFIASCKTDMTNAQRQCVLDARDSASAAACSSAQRR